VNVGARKRIETGAFLVGPNDWESEHVLSEQGVVPEFWMDSVEVTWERFWPCVAQQRCKVHVNASGAYEPGQPVVGIDVEGARAFCAFASGRLPRREEWLRVAAGAQSNRFPWGQTGLVCRRAVYGLVNGPCAEGGTGPEWSGSRPDGMSKDGLLDLVGNVAELVEARDGIVEIRGGSFRSDHAAVLKSWSAEPYRGPREDVGFRCVYDQPPTPSDGAAGALP
jgi:formylglycine-generating enzyme required for sulfatase activity